jgi:hypothetical protein
MGSAGIAGLMATLALLILGWGLAPAPAARADAPFCHVSNTGIESCWFHSLRSCEQRVAWSGGACILNREGTATPLGQNGARDRGTTRSAPLAPVRPAPERPAFSAPFCHVSNSGFESCWYHSLDACQRRIEHSGGLCVFNRQ